MEEAAIEAAGGGGGGGHGAQHSHGGGERPKKENILDLGKYMDKRITVKFNGGREGKCCFVWSFGMWEEFLGCLGFGDFGADVGECSYGYVERV